jgi:hypothetical protein
VNPLPKPCPECGGVMHRGVQPCTDPTHGIVCTFLHIEWRCRFCGYLEGSKRDERPGRRNLLKG